MLYEGKTMQYEEERLRKKTIRTVIIKTLIVIAFIIGCNIFVQSISPEIANDLAMEQMTNRPESSELIRAYSVAMNYMWVVELTIPLLIFIPEIIKLVKYIVRKAKNED